jgi:hypothetical protein
MRSVKEFLGAGGGFVGEDGDRRVRGQASTDLCKSNAKHLQTLVKPPARGTSTDWASRHRTKKPRKRVVVLPALLPKPENSRCPVNE